MSVALAAVGCLLWCAAAQAAKLELSGSVMTFTGDAAQSTSPFITKSSTTYDISISQAQSIAPIPGGCSYTISPYWVSCPAGFTQLKVNLGSAVDSVLAPDVDIPMLINAGEGDDTITGGLLADVINGQGGDDTLRGDGVFGGSLSHDDIDGGDDDDQLIGGVGRDNLHGGSGIDEAYYGDRSADVSITLNDVADDGAAGESDDVFGDVEQLQGGAGNDVLVGNAQANTLLGAGGNDHLTGGGGVDVFKGEAGADALDARDGLAENVNCGDGDDSATADLSDTASNCEHVDASGILQPDADGDGLDDPLDCNDLDPRIRPGRVDIPGNGIDEDCAGGDAINVDRDGDGIPRPRDCNDDNAAVKPGAREIPGNKVDEDCSGRAAPFPRVHAQIVNGWAIFAAYTAVSELGVRGAGGRAKVVVLCHGKGCPYARKTFALRKGAKLDLQRAFRGRRLLPGTVVEIRVLRARMIAKVVRYRVRTGAAPKSTQLCLRPGKKRPGKC